jgi:hypothetical protein
MCMHGRAMPTVWLVCEAAAERAPSWRLGSRARLCCMKSSQAIIHGQIGLAVLVLALGGCTASASFRGGSSTSSTRNEPLPTHTRADSIARSESTAGSDSALTNKADKPEAAKPKSEKPQGQLAVTPPPAREDHDRGHGNDADGVDEDNPGKSKKPGKAKKPEKTKKTDKGDKAEPALAATGADHDRGHGNDADGVDADNPGKSRDK